jgi:8-oxo-dGTP pyrophosphatase MutT (NUDIX family)
MEYFEIFDERGKPTGAFEEREVVHAFTACGTEPCTSGSTARARRYFYTKRSVPKDSHPGLWDVSAAGHIGIGEDTPGSALRELREKRRCCSHEFMGSGHE